ncbi:MAG: TIGR03000 domain-containing protein [Gemmataceae bacterium]
MPREIEARFNRIESSLEKLSNAVSDLANRTASVAPPSGDNTGFLAGNTNVAQSASARVTVYLPENATLYIDGSYCSLTSSKRSFVTPTLEAGKRYFYNLRVDHVENGRTKTHNRKVVLTAGEHVVVHMGLMNISW